MTGSESQARKAVYARLSKIRKFGTRTITMSTELLALFVEDYDLLYKEYNDLKEKIENFEKQKSTLLTSEKLEEFIKISDQVIKINEQTIKDLDQKRETARNLLLDQKCELDETSKNFFIDQDEIKKEYNDDKLFWLSEDEDENFDVGSSRKNGTIEYKYFYETDESNADGDRSNWDTESEGIDNSSSYQDDKIARM
ncbi:8662_t:CDS:2 [Diversispora eburnea]|uniref:8662_t:CDS:1 n=1 Tax=Diversispora eburnea TaxID=1213867 RepID=A0A9N9A5J9_9GLOM|nr:8662_t:CDS:2 [Diversispora eburnea]